MYGLLLLHTCIWMCCKLGGPCCVPAHKHDVGAPLQKALVRAAVLYRSQVLQRVGVALIVQCRSWLGRWAALVAESGVTRTHNSRDQLPLELPTPTRRTQGRVLSTWIHVVIYVHILCVDSS